MDFAAGRGIALREVPLTTGSCDYLLLVDRKALGVLEANKEGTTLSTVADQSARYANSLPAFLADGLTGTLPFLYESTGVETFFRDERDPAPRSRRVFTFHRPETLAEWVAEPDTLRARLRAIPIAYPLARAACANARSKPSPASKNPSPRTARVRSSTWPPARSESSSTWSCG